MNHAIYNYSDIWILLFFTKVANPDFDPSIAGAPSVHIPVNADQDSSSFSKNSENMFIISIM